VPSPGPSPPALDPPPPDDPVAPDQQAQQEWRRADNAATAARRAAEAGGQPVVGTSAYREGLAQEQEADAAFRRGRLADATAAARRAGELYARAVREAAARPTEPLRVGGDVPAPRVTKSVDPVYPPAAIAARVGGSVQVEAQIDASGRVTGARVVRSLPPLDQAALDAVRQWEFAPTVVAGNAVSVLHTVDVPFTPPPVPEPPARPEPGPPNTPPTTLPPPRPVPVDEAAAVRSTIDALAQAYNRRDINAILAIHRTADRASLERYFAGLEYLRAEFSGGRVTLTANNTEATLTGNWIITYRTTTTRGEDRASTPTTFRLRKDGQRWILVSRK
jgi:TonB family protein